MAPPAGRALQGYASAILAPALPPHTMASPSNPWCGLIAICK